MSMTSVQALPSASPDDMTLVQNVFQNWSNGSQNVAIEALRERAEMSDAPWAAAFLSWLLMQQGLPGYDESITWAIRAAREGYGAQLTSVFNNVVANLPNAPQLVDRLPELIELGLPWSGGLDVVANAWNFLATGQAGLAMQVLQLRYPVPLPLADASLAGMVDQARARIRELDSIGAQAREGATEVEATADQARAAIQKAKEDLETSAQQAGLYVTTATADATNALFKEDARRNTKESRIAWVSGLVVLAGAATVAVLPVVLHYLALGVDYSAFEQIALHLISTAALGTFAGVLLARARSRDHAAQRAHDLSTAMGTMITYSSQISDPIERQRFMATMGQVVLQAHLASGGSKSSGNDDSTAGMIALVNSIVKPGTLSGQAAQS